MSSELIFFDDDDVPGALRRSGATIPDIGRIVYRWRSRVGLDRDASPAGRRASGATSGGSSIASPTAS
jgi:hypothetical protein